MADIDNIIFLLSWALPLFWSSIAIGRKSLVSSLLATVTWFTMAEVNTVMAATGTYVMAWLSLGWLYLGFGLIFAVITVVYGFLSLTAYKENKQERQEMEIF